MPKSRPSAGLFLISGFEAAFFNAHLEVGESAGEDKAVISEGAPDNHGPESGAGGESGEDKIERTFGGAGVAGSRDEGDGGQDSDSGEGGREITDAAAKSGDDEERNAKHTELIKERKTHDLKQEMTLVDDGFDAFGVFFNLAESFFAGLVDVFNNMDFGEKTQNGANDAARHLWREGKKDDRNREKSVEKDANKGGGVNDVGEDEVAPEDKREKGEKDKGELSRDEADDRNHSGIFGRDAMLAHMEDLHRLAADSAGGDVVVITADEDGLAGKGKILFLDKPFEEEAVFINFGADGDKKGQKCRNE